MFFLSHLFSVNLISISKLAIDQNYRLTFHYEFGLIQDCATRIVIGLGKYQHGLYTLAPSSVFSPHLNQPSVSTAATQLIWHKRLGHISLQVDFNS